MFRHGWRTHQAVEAPSSLKSQKSLVQARTSMDGNNALHRTIAIAINALRVNI